MNDQTRAEDKLGGLRKRTLELESQLLHLLAGVRAAINEVEEIAREARVETRRREVNFYTEAQLAKKMQVSVDTLQRLRRKHDLPHTLFGSIIRYTDEQVALIAETLERPRRKAKP